MTEQNDQTEPIAASTPTEPPVASYAEVPTAPPVTQPVAASPAPRARRTFGVPVLAGAAAVTLLLGGLVGGIIGYAVHSDGPDFRHGGPAFDGDGGRQFRPGPDGQQGGIPQPPNGQGPGGQPSSAG